MLKHIALLLLVPQMLMAANKADLLKSRTQAFGPSDYYIDLWGSDDTLNAIKENGLTNKHALYVDSHGIDSFSYFVIRPDDSILNGKTAPWFRVKDIAKVLGTNTTNIHNVYFAACNVGGAFDSLEVKKFFPNATNIVHVPRRWKGNDEFFVQAITGFPKDIPNGNCRPLWAELYLPNSSKPYRTVIANRSLLN